MYHDIDSGNKCVERSPQVLKYGDSMVLGKIFDAVTEKISKLCSSDE
jgi:hypothetical protein